MAYRFPVDSTSILLFASALGETNRVFYDDEYARDRTGGVIAPPTFAIASAHWNPEHGFRGVRRIPAAPPRTAEPPGAGPRRRGAEGGNLARVLHAEQRFEYHKPLRPGMVLEVTIRPGKTWEKDGRRGGRLRFSETVSEYRDAAGDLVVTATSVGVVTARAVDAPLDGPAGAGEPGARGES